MILICYDGSTASRMAIARGAAMLPGRPATVMTLWRPLHSEGARLPTASMFLPSRIDAERVDQASAEHARRRAEEGARLARQAGFDARPLGREQVGPLAAAILAQARVLDADAILLGSRGPAGLRPRRSRSVEHKVIHHADRPVIVIHATSDALTHGGRRPGRTADLNRYQGKDRVMFKRVVWATDGSQAADEALGVAAQLASESSGELLAVHCIEMTMPGKGGGRFPVFADEEDLEQKIARQVGELSDRGVTAHLQVTRTDAGHAAQAIAEVAREQQGEVIVVGTRGRGPMAGLLLGSVTQRLLHSAPCPVLAIPAHHGTHG